MTSGYATFSDNIFARRVGRWVSTACESSLYTHALMLVFSNDLLFFLCVKVRGHLQESVISFHHAVPGVGLRLSDLVVSIFPHQTILAASVVHFWYRLSLYTSVWHRTHYRALTGF